MLVFSLTAALLCLFSMGTIKGTIQAQVMDESRRDFSSQISLAQKQLSSANLADSSQYQQLIGNLASELQNNGSGNMIGVYLMSGDDSNIDEKTFVPVSTEPEYTNLISTEMQHDLQSDSDDSIYYQAVNIAKSEKGTPGAILGSTISSNGIGTVKIFALYSYQTQQQALLQIQFNMLVSDVLLSIAIVVIIFSVMRSVGQTGTGCRGFSRNHGIGEFGYPCTGEQTG